MTPGNHVLLVGAISALVVGCTTLAPTEDPVFLKLTDVEARLIRVERVINNQSLIELANQVDQLQAQAALLRGEIETLRFELDNASSRQRDLYLDVDQRLQALESRTVQPAAPTLPMGGVPLTGESNSAVADDAVVSMASPIFELPIPAGDDRDNYNFAYDLLKGGRYSDSRIAFIQFLEAFPISPYADNAQYWLAETRYVQQDFSAALSEFEKVVNIYPNSGQVAGAVLKIGYCYYELQRWDDARIALERVVREYPDTTPAILAAQRLERMSEERG